MRVMAKATLIAIGMTVMTATPALAVGDVAVKLTARQAAVRYTGVRTLLTGNGATCPAGQRPTYGRLTGARRAPGRKRRRCSSTTVRPLPSRRSGRTGRAGSRR